jgi:hypothetical protein
MRIAPGQRVGAALRLGPDLEGAGALAAVDDRLLFALPRGRAIELLSATCIAPDGVPARQRADAGPGDPALDEGLEPPLDRADAAPPGVRDLR